MKKSWMMIAFTFLVYSAATADQLRDFGPGRTANELRESGFNSRIEDRKHFYERKGDGTTVERIVSAQGYYVSAMVSNESGSEISFVELEKLGKAVSRTTCRLDPERKKYFCSTQTNVYCRTLVPLVSEKQLTKSLMKGAGKIDKADMRKILAQIPYDAAAIEKAQKAGVEKISKDFQIPLSKFVVDVPKQVEEVEGLITDYHECRTIEKAWFGSLWAPIQNSSSQKENPPTGRR